MKRSFFQAVNVSILLYGYTTWTLTKRIEKSLAVTTKNAASYIEQVLKAASHKAAPTRAPTSHHEKYQS